MNESTGKPRVLIVEWLCGGGLWVDAQPLAGGSSMFRQGALMRQAIAEDFAAAGCEVLTTTDQRWAEPFAFGESRAIASAEEFSANLRLLASEADYLFVIAPESEGRLLRVLQWLEPFAERLLSPGREWVERFSDKQASCDWLRGNGVRVPDGMRWTEGVDAWPPRVALPAVCKPIDGCGGEGIRLVQDGWEAECSWGAGQWRIESLVAGEPLSVVALLGGGEHLLLQPTRQLFSAEQFGVYAGGEMLEEESLVAAVWGAVAPALRAMTGLRGIVGMDLVAERGVQRGGRAGDAPESAAWTVTVIEVNPRLTSSYLGLRKNYAGNLAGCLLQLVRGERVAEVPLRRRGQGLTWRVD